MAKEHVLVQSEEKFLACVKDRIEKLSSGETTSDEHLGRKELPRCRDIFFVVGGDERVETLDPKCCDSWVSHSISNPASGNTWICSVGHKILVMDRDDEKFLSYDAVTRLWTLLSPPRHYREGASIAQEGRHVYLLGGDGQTFARALHYSDMYDIETDQWERMASLLEGRRDAAATSHAGKVYCSGGCKLTDYPSLFSMEVYGPHGKDFWNSLPPMQFERCLHCLVAHGQFLFAIGGYDGIEYVTAMERFDIDRCQWSSVGAIPNPRTRFSILVHEDAIYVIGGLTHGDWEDNYNKTIEVFNYLQNSWVAASTSLCNQRCNHGSCVIKALPNADQYSSPIA